MSQPKNIVTMQKANPDWAVKVLVSLLFTFSYSKLFLVRFVLFFFLLFAKVLLWYFVFIRFILCFDDKIFTWAFFYLNLAFLNCSLLKVAFPCFCIGRMLYAHNLYLHNSVFLFRVLYFPFFSFFSEFHFYNLFSLS